MNLRYLEWDSEFFGKKIGQIDCDSKDETSLSKTIENAKQKAFQLIYVFTPEPILLSSEILIRFNGTLIDRKVRFEQRAEYSLGVDLNHICEYKDNKVNAELENLAYASGVFSRYKIDKNFEKDDFQNLYKIWITKSVNKEIANKIFIYKNFGMIEGMVTLAFKHDYAQIGLIAVDEKAYGRGVGKKLIEVCKKELSQKSIEKLIVYTQFDNDAAVNFYKKTGFSATNITNIYHFWL